MPLYVKKYLHWAGSALAIVGIVFVALRLRDYGSQLDFARFDTLVWVMLCGLALTYGMINVFLALAWRNLLLHFDVSTSNKRAIKIYGMTQLGRYIPGNIMHFVGRQAMGQAVGIPGWSLVKSSIWELGLLSSGGALISVMLAPRFFPMITISTVVAGLFVTIFFVVLCLNKLISPAVAKSFQLYFIFLLVSGTIFVAVLTLLTGNNIIADAQGFLFCGAFVLAWLAGLVSPGAPAGIGVREFVLLELLNGLVAEPDLLLAILISRIITVGGDVIFFLLASILIVEDPDLGKKDKIL